VMSRQSTPSKLADPELSETEDEVFDAAVHSWLRCPDCECSARLRDQLNFKLLFKYNNSRAPTCQQCVKVARRYCPFCGYKQGYTEPLTRYENHIRKCFDKDIDAQKFTRLLQKEIAEKSSLYGIDDDIEFSSALHAEIDSQPVKFVQVTKTVRDGAQQQRFRQQVFDALESTCVITGETVREVLEAAHIVPVHNGASQSSVSNGIVLRRDLHVLFDLYKISIDPDSWKVVMSDELEGTSYWMFADLKLPRSDLLSQSGVSDSLREHLRRFNA